MPLALFVIDAANAVGVFGAVVSTVEGLIGATDLDATPDDSCPNLSTVFTVSEIEL
jgi:hypothetical protein